ncbi:MAG: hypothetical protein GY861_22085 [bacterium]|nr:hypothetical protein [bacterium]
MKRVVKEQVKGNVNVVDYSKTALVVAFHKGELYLLERCSTDKYRFSHVLRTKSPLVERARTRISCAESALQFKDVRVFAFTFKYIGACTTEAMLISLLNGPCPETLFGGIEIKIEDLNSVSYMDVGNGDIIATESCGFKFVLLYPKRGEEGFRFIRADGQPGWIREKESTHLLKVLLKDVIDHGAEVYCFYNDLEYFNWLSTGEIKC